MIGCLDDGMFGCLDACIYVRLVADLAPKFVTFLEVLGKLWCHLGWSRQAYGSMWARLAQGHINMNPFT